MNLTKHSYQILFLAIAIATISGCGNSNAPETPEPKQTAFPVKVQLAENSQQISQEIIFPALVAGDQEAEISAKSTGNITGLNFDLGKYVGAGTLLARIDDTGNISEEGKNDFQSREIQQLEIALKQAKESLELAQKNYRKDKSFANKSAVKIAELQVKNARISLSAALDNHLITAPIAGTITQKLVSVGDFVSAGQPIAKISKTNLIKFQFYVDEKQYSFFKTGFPVEIIDNDGNRLPAKITNLSPVADNTTRRFLIEARLINYIDPLIGTIVNVSAKIDQKTQNQTSLLLPLSAIAIGQNENSVFIVENSQAKKVTVEILKITGETAEIKGDFAPQTQIIVEGNKVLKEGDEISIE